ncbi:MAG: hypothetical protein VKK59_01970 [Vampirovibrionales bacterium]|nr:hypothetical protein [Vampirovibrionales bacterium]
MALSLSVGLFSLLQGIMGTPAHALFGVGEHKSAQDIIKEPTSAVVIQDDLAPIAVLPQTSLPLTPSKETREASSSEPSSDQDGMMTPAKPIQVRAVVDIDSKTLTYDEKRDVFVARGDANSQVHVLVSEQNSELIADEVTYDKKSQQMIARGHVIILRNGTRTDGTFARIDLSRKSALIQKPVTALEAVRVTAQKSYISQDYYELNNGRLIIDGMMMANIQNNSRMNQASPSKMPPNPSASTTTSMSEYADPFVDPAGFYKAAAKPFEQPSLLSMFDRKPQPLASEVLDLSEPQIEEKSSFSLRAKDIDVYQDEDGYNKIVAKWPSLMFRKFRLATAYSTDFSVNTKAETTEYLGPDIGYNPNLGGLYAGPGFDFRLLNGVARVSPIISYGQAVQRTNGGKTLKDQNNAFGIGLASHFRSKKSLLDVLYSSSSQQVVAFAEHRITPNTRMMASLNQNYSNGFLGTERPAYAAQITDRRKLASLGAFNLESFSTLGALKDDYFPTNRQQFFVNVDDNASPPVAGRAQFQVRLRNNRPLLQMGQVFSMGFEAQGLFSAYSTADFRSILRGGPTAQVTLGPLNSQVRYFASTVSGQSPFAFDAFYQGSQNVSTINQVKITDYLSVGLANSFSLTKNNARNDLIVGNVIYALVGPKDVKVRLSYDIINQRTSAMINFFPSNKDTTIDFDSMHVYPQQTYGLPQGRQLF